MTTSNPLVHRVRRRTLPTHMVVAAALLACSCSPEPGPLPGEDALEARRDALLETHSFSRSGFDPERLGLLAGNGEMGGIVSVDGLGFDSIWCADLWASSEFRVPLEGVKVHLDGARLEEAEIERYTQEQSLRDGKVVTDVRFKDGTGYRSRIFFSATHRRLLAMKVDNLSQNEPLTENLRVPRANYEYLTSWPTYELGTATEDRFRIEPVIGEGRGEVDRDLPWCTSPGRA